MELSQPSWEFQERKARAFRKFLGDSCEKEKIFEKDWRKISWIVSEMKRKERTKEFRKIENVRFFFSNKGKKLDFKIFMA